MIPYGRHHITDDDVEAVVAVLRSDFLTQGPTIPKFERLVADICSAKEAVAVNSATSALHIACMAFEVSEGDVVWTTPISFVASANCALYCGATIDFVDIDLATFNIDIKALESKLEKGFLEGKLPKVLIVVHMAGTPCDMAKIHLLSKRFGFKIIEDASHAFGSIYQNQRTGSCEYSDICVFSFHPVKILTSGEGGCATTNQEDLANAMRKFRTHGITKDRNEFKRESPGDWYYEQHCLGMNYRMTDIQAALGVSQAARLEEIILKRNEIAAKYRELLNCEAIVTPTNPSGVQSSFHLYIIRVVGEGRRAKRDKLFASLRQKNIGVNIHYIPIHLQPFYEKFGFKRGDFPEAEEYYDTAISLPIYPELQCSEQELVTSIVLEELN